MPELIGPGEGILNVTKGNETAQKTPKTKSCRYLADVPDDKVFMSHDGLIFKNLKELGEGLSIMNDKTFRFHVHTRKNDFAKWVQEVIGDLELGIDLKQTMTRTEASRKVMDRVYYCSSPN